MIFSYKCTECGRTFEIKAGLMLCHHCSKNGSPDKPLRGVLEVVLEGKMTHQEFLENKDSIFNLLPCERKYYPSIPVGNTPLWQPKQLRKITAFPNLYLKDDTLNPTASLKDRASYLVSAFAKKHNISKIVVASTGNAASSMAGIGAAAGQDITIFIPKTAPVAKLVQSLQFGARLIPVDGNYDLAFDISLKYTNRTGFMSRNTGYNPMTTEGKKTVSLEIFRDLRQMPDYVFVPVGDGVIISGVYKGFRDLIQLGIAEKMPTIIGVQSDGSNAIFRSFKRNPESVSSDDFSDFETSSTIADSICVDIPRNGYQTLALLRKYKGKMICVSDDSILKAQNELAKNSGLFAEPAAAAAFAGFRQYQNEIPKDACIVLIITGNGLKDLNNALKGVTLPMRTITNDGEVDES